MNNKITFPRLATMLADESGRSKRFSEDFLREFFSIISERLEAGESVKIKGLGTFRLSRVEARKSVDVTTGMPMEISGHTKVVFVPAKELAEAVNAPFEAFTAIEISDDTDIEQLFSKEEIKLADDPDDNEDDEETIGRERTQADVEEIIAPTIDQPEINFQKDSEEEEGSELEDEEYEDFKSEEADGNDIIEGFETEGTNAGDFNVDISGNHTEEISDDRTESEEDADEIEEISDRPEDKDTDNTADYEEPLDSEETEETEETEENAKGDVYLPVPEVMPEATDSDNTDEFDDFDLAESIRNTRKKNWIKGILIVFGAAIVALVATFAVWYVFATNDFNNFFHKDTTAQANEEEFNFTVGKKAETKSNDQSEAQIAIDSVEETTIDNETEEEVPTAPSDAVVYDTISTTRYLTTMAKAHYGNYNLWPYIYEENKAILGHPDRIRPGTPVVIPKLSKYGVDPSSEAAIEKAKKMGVAIYAKYGKSI